MNRYRLQRIAAARHKYLTWFWVCMFIPTLLWWQDSVLWLCMMSLYANIESSAAAHGANKDKQK